MVPRTAYEIAEKYRLRGEEEHESFRKFLCRQGLRYSRDTYRSRKITDPSVEKRVRDALVHWKWRYQVTDRSG